MLPVDDGSACGLRAAAIAADTGAAAHRPVRPAHRRRPRVFRLSGYMFTISCPEHRIHPAQTRTASVRTDRPGQPWSSSRGADPSRSLHRASIRCCRAGHEFCNLVALVGWVEAGPHGARVSSVCCRVELYSSF